MRLFVLALVLANLAFYAWWRHIAPQDEAGEPGRAEKQIAPQALPIVPLAPAAQSSVGPGTCREWGSFAAADLARARQALQALAPGAVPIERQVEESTAWWVFIAPAGSRDAAQKKTAELKGLGISDYFVVQEEGPERWAISLGIFRSEALARARLETLREKRVRTAQIGTRDKHRSRTWLQTRALTADQIESLPALVKQFEGSELRECAAG